MYAVGRLSSYISQGVYTVSAPFHPFGGAVDIIVVQQPDGSFKSSPWYVKFGKFQGVLKTREKVVNINVNGYEADFHMYLDHKGEAYFLREVDGDECDISGLSPSSSGDEIDDPSQNGRNGETNSYDYKVNQPNLNAQIDVGGGKIIARTSSRRSRIFGLMFGRKSMKEDSMQRQGSDDSVTRISSLERAEIAANLLDVNWSTNLPSDRPRKDEVSRLSSSYLSAEESDKDLQVNDDKGQERVLVHDSIHNSSDHSNGQKEAAPCHEGMCSSSGSPIGKTECPKGESSRPEKLDKEISTEASALEKSEGTPETSEGITEADTASVDIDERVKEPVSDCTTPFVQNLHLNKLDGDDIMQHNMEHPSEEMVQFLTVAVPSEESGNLYIYSEAPESSIVDFDVSSERNVVTLDCSCGECEEDQVGDGVLSVKVNTNPEWAALISKEVSDDLRSSNDEDFGKAPNTKAICGTEGNSFSDTTSPVTESHCSYDIHLLTSKSGEARMLEIIQADIKSVEVFKNRSQVMGVSHSLSDNCRVGFEEPSKASGSHVQIVSLNQVLHSIEEAELQGVCISSSLSNSISLVQEEEYLGPEKEMNELHHAHSVNGEPQGSSPENILTKPTTISTIPPTEISGDDQFFFSDINDFVPSGAQYENSVFKDSAEMGNYPLVSMDSFQESQGSNDMNLESYLYPLKHVQQCSLNSSDAPNEESMTTSSPMSIPKCRKSEAGDIEGAKSLPNFRSHIDNLEMDDLVHPLSHSLDSHSGNLNWGPLRNDVSRSPASGSDSEHQQKMEDLTLEDLRTWEELKELKNMSADSAVEISMCKHLLYEGMGADSASQAFDAEKVDLEKFVSLGPGVVKNDKVIVRIGGHYFPWAAAAPIILGMTIVDLDQILEPKGMIPVCRVEKTAEGEQSKASLPSGGSWKLWPFTFKRSSTISSTQPTPDTHPAPDTQPAPDGTTVSASVNASERINNVTADDTTGKVNIARKKVQSLVPTSEQLATLNLKEGQNVITFTFSTAMLGKQQVDARVYLWRWNSRIVISDVDGTITKSDVLGQFMPLVGKDWSQTGVTHLFSAIKENGYQMLFLSARAISQASLTRQFLFNLKQDGKVLPDGPVVISPDGLFPSLFREVIRRAPHEFKIACLKDIRDLFPADCNPFYAGFGNRDTDEFSYLKVGIPKGKIFIINPKGEVHVNRRLDGKSYTSLHALVNGMFPATSSTEQEEFNSWNFWRTPLPNLDY